MEQWLPSLHSSISHPSTQFTLASPHYHQCLVQFLHQLIGNRQGTECSEVSRNPLRFEVKVTQDVYCKD